MNDELLKQLPAALPQFKWSESAGRIWGETQGGKVWWQMLIGPKSIQLTIHDGVHDIAWRIAWRDQYPDGLSAANIVGRVVGLVLVAKKKLTAWLEELSG